MVATCNECGAVVGMDRAEGGADMGDEFTEYHSCINGHTGTISGTVGEPVGSWQRTGAIFG